jgi:iron complex outermembrane receptor protein
MSGLPLNNVNPPALCTVRLLRPPCQLSVAQERFGNPTDAAYTLIKRYTPVNASRGYRNKGGEIDAFARNLFDTNYILDVTIQASNLGLILGTAADPRTIGVTFRARQ